MTATLYGDLKASGVPIDNNGSSLYFQDSALSRAILSRWSEKAKSAMRFESTRYGGAWWDVPFAFLPWWEQHEQRRLCRALGQPEVIEPDDLQD